MALLSRFASSVLKWKEAFSGQPYSRRRTQEMQARQNWLDVSHIPTVGKADYKRAQVVFSDPDKGTVPGLDVGLAYKRHAVEIHIEDDPRAKDIPHVHSWCLFTEHPNPATIVRYRRCGMCGIRQEGWLDHGGS